MKKRIESGDKVLYGTQEGEVLSVMGDTAIVKLSDGKEYSLPYGQLTPVKSMNIAEPGDMRGAIDALRPFIKNMGFLDEMASMMNAYGVSEFAIKAGKVAKFEAKESLEEKIAKYKAQAAADAEKRAREEWLKEHSQATA